MIDEKLKLYKVRRFKKNLVFRLLRIFAAFILAACGLLLFNGCASKEQIVTRVMYREIFIPVACNVQIPGEPEKQENAVLAVIELKNYVERLKAALNACVSAEGRFTSELELGGNSAYE